MFLFRFLWFKGGKKGVVSDGIIMVVVVVVVCGDVVFIVLFVVYDGMILELDVEEKCIVYEVLLIL